MPETSSSESIVASTGPKATGTPVLPASQKDAIVVIIPAVKCRRTDVPSAVSSCWGWVGPDDTLPVLTEPFYLDDVQTLSPYDPWAISQLPHDLPELAQVPPQNPCSLDPYAHQFNPSMIAPFHSTIYPRVGEYMNPIPGILSRDHSVIGVPGDRSCWLGIDYSYTVQGQYQYWHTPRYSEGSAYLNDAFPTELHGDEHSVETRGYVELERDFVPPEIPQGLLEVRMPRPKRVHELNIASILANLHALACDSGAIVPS
ncbi:hypothetical protein C8Q76DRAFT_694579 [Earliella scabrosa]|nr:hypothetical protein C8Q76DRAFT_694579 [Earliella scabrosa]